MWVCGKTTFSSFFVRSRNSPFFVPSPVNRSPERAERVKAQSPAGAALAVALRLSVGGGTMGHGRGYSSSRGHSIAPCSTRRTATVCGVSAAGALDSTV